MVTSLVEKRLGALPVAAEFPHRLNVAGIVDEVCPSGASAHLTHGQVIKVRVANRLTSPAPLVRVRDWARTWAVEKVFGITADVLTDDRLARALDAIAPQPEGHRGHRRPSGDLRVRDRRLPAALGHDQHVRARRPPRRGPDEQYPLIACNGHPKDRRLDLK